MSSWQLDFERPAKKALNRLPATCEGAYWLPFISFLKNHSQQVQPNSLVSTTFFEYESETGASSTRLNMRF